MRKLKVAHVKISQNRKGTCDEKIRRNFISTSRPDVIKKLSQFYRNLQNRPSSPTIPYPALTPIEPQDPPAPPRSGANVPNLQLAKPEPPHPQIFKLHEPPPHPDLAVHHPHDPTSDGARWPRKVRPSPSTAHPPTHESIVPGGGVVIPNESVLTDFSFPRQQQSPAPSSCASYQWPRQASSTPLRARARRCP